MAQKKKSDFEVEHHTKAPEKEIEGICPGCGKEMGEYRCRFCGTTKTINQVSGNVIFMRNGRIVSAFTDEKAAFIQMAIKHNIPQEQWPKQFKEED
jgi:methionyl-tRNA synthetase